jgi:hypothetical protein
MRLRATKSGNHSSPVGVHDASNHGVDHHAL